MNDKQFQEYGWLTPSQIRDSLLIFPVLDTEMVQRLKVLALNEQARRSKIPELYIQCPRCKGFHEQKTNIDGLCDKCETDTACFRYDKTHGIL